MNAKECEGCFFLNSENFDGQVGCSRTGDPLAGKKVCLDDGPFIRLPRTPAELNEIITAAERRWRRDKVELSAIALVK